MPRTKQGQSVSDKIEYEEVDNLYLDPNNPRLGREIVATSPSQDAILDLMKEWTLEELGVSFCESGFWPQEALIVVQERIEGVSRLVVVEGNRRLAALKLLASAVKGEPVGGAWLKMVQGLGRAATEKLLRKIPYMLMPSRASVKSYLGFRHVTGIKEWNPAEKAQFIAELIENDGLSYEQVRRRIGSKTPAVRQNYISYRLLQQMEQHSEKVDIEKVEDRFSVLYLSIRTEGVQKYLSIDIEADPVSARKPVPRENLKQLVNFAKWLFGDAKHAPLFTDSRRVEDFGHVLLNQTAVDYLERTEKPSFEVARRMAGVSEQEVAKHVEVAADETEEALRAAHHHKDSSRLEDAVLRLALNAIQLSSLFPKVAARAKKEMT